MIETAPIHPDVRQPLLVPGADLASVPPLRGTGFSQAGKRKGFADPQSSLYFAMLEWVDLKPLYAYFY